MPRRLRPEQHPGIDLRVDDPRIVWAKSAKASSEWSSSYGPRGACGKPTIYPRGGDLTPSWLAANDDARPWIELTFPDVQTVEAIIVCETCGPGAVISIEDLDAKERLYDAPPETIEASREARLLVVPLEPRTPPRRLRLRLAPYSFGSEYHEIDAVGLVRVPFEELAQPYVPPPPPPTPEELLTVLAGTLRGASPDVPLLHAKLLSGGRTRAWSSSGPLRLALGGDHEVEVLCGETALYGVPLVRARGAWADVARAYPAVARTVPTPAPAPAQAVTLELRMLTRQSQVELAGEVRNRVEGGFREGAAGPPRTIEARAICAGRLASSRWANEGLDGFQRLDTRAEPRAERHPLTGWLRGLGVTGLLGIVGLLAAVLGLGPDSELAAILACLAPLPAVHAAECLARTAAVPEIVSLPAAFRSDRRPWFVAMGWSVTTSMLGYTMSIPLFGLAMSVSRHPDSPLLAFLAAGGLLALARLALTLRPLGPTLLTATRLALAGSRARPGALVALTGVLGEGEHDREEDYLTKSEYLGTETTTDEQGRTTTHDRFRTWYERRVRARGPGELSLFLPDGTPVRTAGALRSTDVSMIHVKGGTRDEAYARFRGAHSEGDEAAVVGLVQQTGPELVLSEATVVLGGLRALRRRVAWTWLGVVLLLSIGLVGVAAVVQLFA